MENNCASKTDWAAIQEISSNVTYMAVFPHLYVEWARVVTRCFRKASRRPTPRRAPTCELRRRTQSVKQRHCTSRPHRHGRDHRTITVCI